MGGGGYDAEDVQVPAVTGTMMLYDVPVHHSLFRPEMYWWRLVLTLRKFCEVAVALMFSSKPLFQAW
jgi:hypothetical protein